MDETGEMITAESSTHPISVHSIENDPVDELSSVTNDPDLTIFPSSQCSIPPSKTEDTQNIQPIINDTTDTDFVIDSVTDDQLNDTPLEEDTVMDEIPDETLATDDTSINSNSTDPVTETNKAKKIKPDQKSEKISQFPLGRVRDIMKSDPDIKVVNAECVFLVAKATEMFLQRLGTEIHAITVRNKKKTLQKKDLDAVISENVAFEFLDGALN